MTTIEQARYLPQLVTGDAFGEMLKRCWAAGGARDTAFEVVERDDGFIIAQDVAIYFDPPEKWPATERWAVERSVGRVLDFGCGAGRHMLALQASGHDVVGLDESPGALEVAREQGLNVYQGTFADPPASLGTFDTFLMMGNNIGLLGDPAETLAVLKKLADLANPGALLFGTGLNIRGVPPDRISYDQWCRERGQPVGVVRLRLRDRLIATPWFNYTMVNADDVSKIANGSPWELEDVSLDGIHYLAQLRLRA